jgi:hypothetical protein
MSENNGNNKMGLAAAFAIASVAVCAAYAYVNRPAEAPNSANAVVATDQAVALKPGQRVHIVNGELVLGR